MILSSTDSPASGGGDGRSPESSLSPRVCRVLLAHEPVSPRRSVRGLVDGLRGYSLIAECTDGAQALAMALRLNPDVVVLDFALPKLGALEVMDKLQARAPGTKMIVCDLIGDECELFAALFAHAAACIARGAIHEDLPIALREVAVGRRYISPALRPLLGGWLPESSDPKAPRPGY
jgi:two-component system, NarL family, response regulator LiaR